MMSSKNKYSLSGWLRNGQEVKVYFCHEAKSKDLRKIKIQMFKHEIVSVSVHKSIITKSAKMNAFNVVLAQANLYSCFGKEN